MDNNSLNRLKNMNITIAGLGMEGGSMALAIKEWIRPKKIYGISRTENTIKAAEALEAIDKGSINPQEILEDTDLLILSMYPSGIVEFLRKNQEFLKPGTVITDLAGTKKKLVPEILSFLRDDLDFIPGHPMAGNEFSGFLNADKAIFYNANYILTPTERNKPENIDLIKTLALEIKCKGVEITDIDTHDKKIAYASQLVHAISVAITNSPSYDDQVEYFVGGSFKDITRVARINPNLWTDAFLESKEDLLIEMDKFLKEFIKLKDALEIEDYEKIWNILEHSRQRRSREI
ncbi:prephenate dehydrogenase [Miniphocaeibacter halophilus]|uniref:Prephenate dehydrogenase n=1 Tax=Miniphocaeibacter halophilus TaxID=2931922 RepID=A0AC61MSJ1_9FIRM|nr:prephenate dehydrogenase [Miniphocaeibacter halophilus]QQK08447.1 prephenate dehydrogenase [Miniphocaeibacter halophilus]